MHLSTFAQVRVDGDKDVIGVYPASDHLPIQRSQWMQQANLLRQLGLQLLSLLFCHSNPGRPEINGHWRLAREPDPRLGFLYARAGRTNDALDVLHQVIQRQRPGQPENSEVALIEHGLGNDAKALDLLERAVESREGGLLWLAISPYWKDLRSHPRVQAILRKMNLVE